MLILGIFYLVFLSHKINPAKTNNKVGKIVFYVNIKWKKGTYFFKTRFYSILDFNI